MKRTRASGKHKNRGFLHIKDLLILHMYVLPYYYFLVVIVNHYLRISASLNFRERGMEGRREREKGKRGREKERERGKHQGERNTLIG